VHLFELGSARRAAASRDINIGSQLLNAVPRALAVVPNMKGFMKKQAS
jgi:hypothetical protein